jgi:hypothetical protein
VLGEVEDLLRAQRVNHARRHPRLEHGLAASRPSSTAACSTMRSTANTVPAVVGASRAETRARKPRTSDNRALSSIQRALETAAVLLKRRRPQVHLRRALVAHDPQHRTLINGPEQVTYPSGADLEDFGESRNTRTVVLGQLSGPFSEASVPLPGTHSRLRADRPQRRPAQMSCSGRF